MLLPSCKKAAREQGPLVLQLVVYAVQVLWLHMQPYLAAVLACWHCKRPDACHNVSNNLPRLEAGHQPLVLSF